MWANTCSKSTIKAQKRRPCPLVWWIYYWLWTSTYLRGCNNFIDNPFQCSDAFHIETSHLNCSANQMTGFYMKYNTELKWINFENLGSTSIYQKYPTFALLLEFLTMITFSMKISLLKIGPIYSYTIPGKLLTEVLKEYAFLHWNFTK